MYDMIKVWYAVGTNPPDEGHLIVFKKILSCQRQEHTLLHL